MAFRGSFSAPEFNDRQPTYAGLRSSKFSRAVGFGKEDLEKHLQENGSGLRGESPEQTSSRDVRQMAALLMRRDEAFVQAVEELKMEKPTKLEPRCCVARVRSASRSQQLL
ncbi:MULTISPECIES: hypothetical protein [unclassified Bradyrhizobium]|uniref:hypothetical protein n=1 Tax=unclassified Bradyrhizobium TaxID=2631580 RepID=UPI001FFB74AB|nr:MULTISPECIES: hypothetical protein [unclassified Bradyrhizobium]MCK1314441.1 hypothetical protein [Bradyrhizobium sp. 23]MCK1508970.1 hypothetical protein [Bradyrhizobium sp. 18]